MASRPHPSCLTLTISPHCCKKKIHIGRFQFKAYESLRIMQFLQQANLYLNGNDMNDCQLKTFQKMKTYTLAYEFIERVTSGHETSSNEPGMTYM